MYFGIHEYEEAIGGGREKMKLEQVSPNLTFYWSDEENFELHKALLFGTSSRSHKNPQERKEFYEEKGLTTKADSFFIQNLGFGDKSIA